MAKPVRTKNKDNARRAKKKVSLLLTERVEYVDWKDVNLLRRFMSDRAKIRARRVTGNSTQQQAEIARAIKNAREMALLPYASRVTQTRGPKRDGERGGRRERDRDLPAPDTEPMQPRRATRRSRSSAPRSSAPRSRRHRGARRGDGRRHGGRVVKLVLRSDVAQVGKKGDIVDVADGYGRNFLVPKGLAFLASSGVEAQATAMRRSRDVRDASDRAAAQEVATVARAEGRHDHGPRRRRGQALRLGDHRRDRRRGRGPDGRRARPPPAPPRRADQDPRHPPRAGQAPRRGRVPDHGRGRRLLGPAVAGRPDPRPACFDAPWPEGCPQALSTARSVNIPRVSPGLCLW